MGEYRDGRWQATFGDVQFGAADEAPGESPMPSYNERLLQRVAELEAKVAKLNVNKRVWYQKGHRAGMERAAEMVQAQSVHSDFPYTGHLMAGKIRKEMKK